MARAPRSGHSGEEDAPTASPLRRLGWFVAIWALSVLALGVVGYAIKLSLGQ